MNKKYNIKIRSLIFYTILLPLIITWIFDRDFMNIIIKERSIENLKGLAISLSYITFYLGLIYMTIFAFQLLHKNKAYDTIFYTHRKTSHLFKYYFKGIDTKEEEDNKEIVYEDYVSKFKRPVFYSFSIYTVIEFTLSVILFYI